MGKNVDDLDLDNISRRAGEKADRQAGDAIEESITLTREEVEKLFPEPGDREKFRELAAIVTSADERNQKKTKILQRAEEFSGVIVTLLEKVI